MNKVTFVILMLLTLASNAYAISNKSLDTAKVELAENHTALDKNGEKICHLFPQGNRQEGKSVDVALNETSTKVQVESK